MSRHRNSGKLAAVVLVLAAVAGIALNLHLLIASQSDPGAGIGGCGGGGCADVLNSRWAKAFLVPVTAFGLLAHLAVLVSMFRPARPAMVPLLGLVFGSIVWFSLVQVLILKTFCPLCLTAHAVAGVECLAGWRFLHRSRRSSGNFFRSAVTWSLAGFLGIALVQIYGPIPPTHRVVELDHHDAAAPESVHALGGGRLLEFPTIQKSFAVEHLPRIGPSGAKHVLVEYFDYRCAACRTTSGFIDALIARHPADVAVIVLPVPLESSCNSSLPPQSAQHPGSCELARLSLAVWHQAPDEFAEFHRQRMADPSLEAARRAARAIIPAERFKSAMANPAIDELLQANIRDWAAFSKMTDRMPKLLIPTGKIVHGPPSGEADFIQRLEQELGLAPGP